MPAVGFLPAGEDPGHGPHRGPGARPQRLCRTSEGAFVETKRRLVDEYALWTVVSLPGGVFPGAGAGVKTNLLLFTKGAKDASLTRRARLRALLATP
jgi:hypothetical protein